MYTLAESSICVLDSANMLITVSDSVKPAFCHYISMYCRPSPESLKRSLRCVFWVSEMRLCNVGV